MSPDHPEEPFALSGLAALVATAAENSPDHVLLEDDDGFATGADVERRARRLARQLRLGGLRPGERVLIVAGAQAASVVALVAVLRAGLEPILVPCGTTAVALAGFAIAAHAAALIGPSRYGAWEAGDVYLSAAGGAESIRGILTHGPDRIDGAADISSSMLDAMADAAETEADEPETPRVWTIGGPSSAPRLVAHSQAALFADALSLVEQAHINPTKRLIALMPASSLAGLVGGPYAAFVGASRLVLHGPFSAPRFLAHCDAEPAFHLVAPAAFGPVLEEKALAADISSLILVSRHVDPDAFALPMPVACGRPVIDLYAFGEDGVIAQRRHDGEASPPKGVADSRVTAIPTTAIPMTGLPMTDPPMADGLGDRLNRARAGHRSHDIERLLGSDIVR